jgi:hypothetical protein
MWPPGGAYRNRKYTSACCLRDEDGLKAKGGGDRIHQEHSMYTHKIFSVLMTTVFVK